MKSNDPDSDEFCALDTSLIDQAVSQARDLGALLEIETEHESLIDAGIPFRVRWIASLATKDAARVRAAGEKRPGFNPFLPPQPELFIADFGTQHRIVLNKYPVIKGHLLIVTRHFEAQTAALTTADFCALAGCLKQLGGLGFYNGGPEAGASQPHKHLQWIPSTPDGASLGRFTDSLSASPLLEPIRRPDLPWQHAFVRHALAAAPTAAQHLGQAFALACKATGLAARDGIMPPYNLLADREWLLLVPRSREQHQGISINSLGYAGSLFVRRPDQIKLVRQLGALRLLASVAR